MSVRGEEKNTVEWPNYTFSPGDLSASSESTSPICLLFSWDWEKTDCRPQQDCSWCGRTILDWHSHHCSLSHQSASSSSVRPPVDWTLWECSHASLVNLSHPPQPSGDLRCPRKLRRFKSDLGRVLSPWQ